MHLRKNSWLDFSHKLINQYEKILGKLFYDQIKEGREAWHFVTNKMHFLRKTIAITLG